MSENIHTGHGINIRNFKEVIQLSQQFGLVYDPCNDYLKVPHMLDNWKLLMHVNELYTIASFQCKVLIRERDNTFRQLNKKITKLCGIACSLNETPHFKQEVKDLADKIRGFRYKRTSESAEVNESARALSFIKRTENFKKLIDLLLTSQQYRPNEKGFSAGSLNMEYKKMCKLNEQIDEKSLIVSKARKERNNVLYDTETGVLQTMKACRSYIKGLFGPGSPEYKMISELKFRVLPKKYAV